jgi:hypothetical protein
LRAQRPNRDYAEANGTLIWGPPDFVGVGAQRCGTTWWYELICEHPGVQSGLDKERHFFDVFATTEMTDADLASYRRGFPRADGQIAGEWTPRYAYDFWTPSLLRRAAPEAKLLFMIRDPLARLRSGIRFRLSMDPPDRPLELARICTDAAARGCYADQLERLLRWFCLDQVHVLQYERCVADPSAEIERTYGFLGIDDRFRPANLKRARGWSTPDLPLPQAVVDLLSFEAEAQAARLADLVPSFDPSLWSCINNP